MKNLKRISLLMAKVILVGTIFYPISLFYPDLQWHFSFMECVRMLLGYSGNYEWWFLRPYLIIAALSPFLLKGINKKSVICLTISLLLYFLTKYLLYFLFAVLFGCYPRQIWHIGLGEKYISITLCCILVYNRPYGYAVV